MRDDDVLQLVRVLYDAGFNDSGGGARRALEAEQKLVALTIQDREAILRTLDDPPDELAELRVASLTSRGRPEPGPPTTSESDGNDSATET